MRSPKRFVYVLLGVIQMFVSLGALISGALLVIVPSGSLLQAPPEMLKGSPFSDFLLPGIILFLVNGVGQGFAGVMTIRRHSSAGFVGAAFGLGLMIWIFVQVNMIGGGHILQYSYFLIGVVETVLAFVIQARGEAGNIARASS